MLHALRKLGTVVVLEDEEEFWRHCDRAQRPLGTPQGVPAEAEWQLDLEAAETIKSLLEREVGPEEGAHRVQAQNWDWNDDRRRAVYILTDYFMPELLLQLQGLLNGKFKDFQVVVMLHDKWDESPWGSMLLSCHGLMLPEHVARRYAIAA